VKNLKDHRLMSIVELWIANAKDMCRRNLNGESYKVPPYPSNKVVEKLSDALALSHTRRVAAVDYLVL